MLSYMRKHQEQDEDRAFMAHVEGGGRAADFRFRPPPAAAPGGPGSDVAEVEGEMGAGSSGAVGAAAARAFGRGKEVKAHHLLVLLLRLRQVRLGESLCCTVPDTL